MIRFLSRLLPVTLALAVAACTSSGSSNPGGTAGAPSDSFGVSAAPASIAAGSATVVTLQALNPGQQVVSGYSGTVHVTTDDPAAPAIPDVVFTPADKGVKSISVKLVTAGLHNITASDAARPRTGSGSVTVTPGAPTFVASLVGDINAGVATSFLLKVQDVYGNAVTGYTGTVGFASSDAAATLPPDTTLQASDAGQKSFSVTFGSVGMQTVTATDKASPTLAVSRSTHVHGLVYTNPNPAFGTLQVVAGAGSTGATMVLNVVVNKDVLAAFGAGFNLPLADPSKVSLDAVAPITPGPSGFAAGTLPLVSRAVIPASGPLQGSLVTAVTQQNGSMDPARGFPIGNQTLFTRDAAGNPVVVYAVRLHVTPTATPGLVFDGSSLPAGYHAAVRDQEGNDQAQNADFLFGRLEVQ